MIRHKSFLPTRESLLVIWLLNFVAKLQEHRVLLGFTTAEVDVIAGAVSFFRWIVDVTNHIPTDSKQFTAYKLVLRIGPEGRDMSEVPQFNLPVAPGGIVPVSGLSLLTRRYAGRIKRHDNYSEALGHDFGIIGPEDPFNPDVYKTNIIVKVFDLYREVHFVKGRAEDVVIYTREAGTTPWHELGTGTASPVVDNRPTPQPVVMEFMAKGRLKNVEIGLPSNIVQVTYGGTTVAE